MNKMMHITPALTLTILQKGLLMVANFFGGWGRVGMNPLKAELCFFPNYIFSPKQCSY